MVTEGEKAVAALSGLVLRRVQIMAQESIEGADTKVCLKDLAEIFGEALQQFSQDPDVGTHDRHIEVGDTGESREGVS